MLYTPPSLLSWPISLVDMPIKLISHNCTVTVFTFKLRCYFCSTQIHIWLSRQNKCYYTSMSAVKIYVKSHLCAVNLDLRPVSWHWSTYRYTACNCTLHCGNYSSHPKLYSQTCQLTQIPLSPGPGSKTSASWPFSWRDRSPAVHPYVWRWGGTDYKHLPAC